MGILMPLFFTRNMIIPLNTYLVSGTIHFAIAGFKFVNTGKSKVTGIDISLNGQAKFGKAF